MFIGYQKNEMEERGIINEFILKEKLSEVDWNCSNQTLKVLKRIFYERIEAPEQFAWIDEKEDKPFSGQPEEKDVKEISDIIFKIANYMSLLWLLTKEATVSEIKDAETLTNYLINDVGLKRVNPLMDKLLASAVILTLYCVQDLSNELAIEANIIAYLNEMVGTLLDTVNKQYCADNEECSNTCWDIDTSKLHVGDTIKNYKALCDILGTEIKTGKARQLQLEDFKRYFDWEKSNQKFIITDIYDIPLNKEDKRKLGNNNVYVKYIETILLRHLSKQEGYAKTFKKSELWRLLGMVNSKYNKIAPKDLESMSYIITPFQINHFYQRCNQKLERILFTALNNLQNRKLLVWELQTVIVDGDDKYFLASDYQRKAILNAEHDVLREMGLEKIIQVYFKFKQTEYYNRVNEKLYILFGWKYFFKQIKIIYEPSNVVEALSESEIRLQKSILNQKIMDALQANAEQNYYKKQKMREEEYRQLPTKALTGIGVVYSPDSDEVKTFRLQHTYLEAQKMLTDELVSIGNRKSKISLDLVLQSAEQEKELDDLFEYLVS